MRTMTLFSVLAAGLFTIAVVTTGPASATGQSASTSSVAATVDTPAGDGPVFLEVIYDRQGNALTIVAEEASIQEIAAEVERATGVIISVSSAIPEDEYLTVELYELPLEEALQELLINHSYVTKVDPETDQTTLSVHSSNTGREVTRRAQPRAVEPSAGFESGNSAVTILFQAPDPTAEPVDDSSAEAPAESDAETSADAEAAEEPPYEGPRRLIDVASLAELDAAASREMDAEDLEVTSDADHEVFQAERDEARAALEAARVDRALKAMEYGHRPLTADAISALVGSRDARATATIAGLARNRELPKDDRHQAVEALIFHAGDLQFEDQAALQALGELSRDEDPSVRRMATRALDDVEQYKRDNATQ